ncbi:MAG: hypothetical protein Q9160_000295 [Pyrenula sp. 1 TL-2023]
MEVDSSTSLEHPHPHPHPNMNPHHRKISLQSPLDLSYLRSNLLSAARSRLDLHFPPSHSQPSPPLVINLDGAGDVKPKDGAEEGRGGQHGTGDEDGKEEDDPMRARVSSLVREFIAQTFETAKAGIEINGIDADAGAMNPSQPQILDTEHFQQKERVEFEAYDPRLTAKVASLYAETERLSALVAGLRRRAPREGAAGVGEKMKEVVVAETCDEGGEGDVEMDDVAGLDIEGVNVGGEGGDDWQTEVEKMYERGVGELAVLSGLDNNYSGSGSRGEGGSGRERGTGRGQASQMSLTETVGKVQRAGVVMGEFE